MNQPVNVSGPQRRTTIVLTALVAVLVVAAGLFLTLFLVERGAVREANDQITVTERDISAERDKLGDANSTVDDLEAKGKDLQTKNDKYQSCVDSSVKALKAAQANNDPELDKAIDEMIDFCARDGGGS